MTDEIKDAEILEVHKEGGDDSLFVAGIVKEGENKGQYIAIQVRNMMQLNPVEPIFAQYPDMEFLIVGKSEEIVKKYFQKLI